MATGAGVQLACISLLCSAGITQVLAHNALRSTFLTKPLTSPCANQGFAYGKSSWTPIETIQKGFGVAQLKIMLLHFAKCKRLPEGTPDPDVARLWHVQSCLLPRNSAAFRDIGVGPLSLDHSSKEMPLMVTSRCRGVQQTYTYYK